jgi:hypothetical protein
VHREKSCGIIKCTKNGHKRSKREQENGGRAVLIGSRETHNMLTRCSHGTHVVSERVRETSSGVNKCIGGSSSVGTGVRISIYLRESLKSLKWLIPEVAQPQVPPSKKLCALTQQNRRSKRNERSGVK